MEVAASQGAPLQAEFVEWWFAPWDYVACWPGDMVLPRGQVGRRDGYAMWCAQAGVTAEFPGRVETGWQNAALRSAARLETVALLFAGLLAAREKDLRGLQGLGPGDRRWCMSIAALQPLLSLAGQVQTGQARMSLKQRGLLEIRAWLEAGFPGMWSRLRHLLPAEAAEALDALPAQDRGADELSAGAIKRAQRCWQLCCDRAAAADEAGEDDDDDGDALAGQRAAPARQPITKRA